MKTKQTDLILQHLQKFDTITPHEALKEYGIMRLASRISDLKSDGYKIKKVMRKGINKLGGPCRYAEYSLEVEV